MYTGGLANCITCNAIDIVPSYDNYMNIDDKDEDDNINEEENNNNGTFCNL